MGCYRRVTGMGDGWVAMKALGARVVWRWWVGQLGWWFYGGREGCESGWVECT